MAHLISNQYQSVGIADDGGSVRRAVNGTRVKSVAELQAAAKKSGKTVALLIQRGEQQLFLPVRVE